MDKEFVESVVSILTDNGFSVDENTFTYGPEGVGVQIDYTTVANNIRSLVKRS